MTIGLQNLACGFDPEIVHMEESPRNRHKSSTAIPGSPLLFEGQRTRQLPHAWFELFLSDKFLLPPMKYRNRTEIASYMLDIALGGANKTKIMYKAFLSHDQMKQYLELLLSNGLLELDKNQIYRTTEKGMRFLKIYQELSKLSPQLSTSGT